MTIGSSKTINIIIIILVAMVKKAKLPETENFDYFLTDEAIFIQHGTYPNDSPIIAVPIYLRAEDGDRIVDGVRCKKFNTQYEDAPSHLQAIWRSDLGPDEFEVDRERITKVYKHRTFQPEGEKKEIADTIASILGRDVSMIGSCLFAAEKPQSDYDFLVYGLGGFEDICNRWTELTDAIGASEPAQEDYLRRAQKYSDKYNFNPAELAPLLERRKSRWVTEEGRVLSVIFSYNPGETPNYNFKKRNDWREIETEDLIIDSKHSAMMPRFYQGENHKIFSFRWIDQSLARDGEMVKIKGKINDDKEIFLANENSYILPK